MSVNPITVCLIVKNEEYYLDRCLQSVKDACSDIIVVDTGSSDSTLSIAATYTSKLLRHRFTGDFSAARNAALEHVRTDWVLFLDADERLEPLEAAKLPKLVKSATDDILSFRLLRYNFFATGGFYTGRQLKLFRSHPQIRYRRRINESVTEAIVGLGGRIVDASVLMNHFGHCRSLALRTEKAWRYIALMKEQLAEQPNDAILHGYIGLILRTLGHFAEALTWSSKAVELSPASATVQMFHGHVLRSAGDYVGADAAYRRAIQLRPNDGAAWNMAGVIAMTLGDLDSASEAFTRAREVDPLLAHVLINQGMVAQWRGDFSTAMVLYEEAARRNPGFLHEEWAGKVEQDPYREFYYETVTEYAGLGYYLAYCQQKVRDHDPKLLSDNRLNSPPASTPDGA